MIVTIRKADLAKQLPITPGLYKGKVLKVAKPTTKGDRIDQEITVGFDDAVLAANGMEVDHTFYNCIGSGIGFTIQYFAAIENKSVKVMMDEMENDNVQLDFDLTVGKSLSFNVINEPYQGRILNKISGFLPYDYQPPL